MHLLLLSSSRLGASGYLEHARPFMRDLFGPAVTRLTFLPYARVIGGYDTYLEQVRGAFSGLGYAVDGIHTADNPVAAIEEAEAIVVGGGNTWHLAREVHRLLLSDAIRRKVRAGTPYLGWSAGTNLACPVFQTTNDMPICEPLGFDGLGLIPFQINPHYLHGNPPGFHGETREERIREFLELHPATCVVGLPEGSMFRLDEGTLRLLGGPCRIFQRGRECRELGPADSFDFLLK